MTLSVIVQEAWENSPRVRAQRKHLGGTWPSRGCVDTVGGKTNHKTGLQCILAEASVMLLHVADDEMIIRVSLPTPRSS